jgi:signal transduction histidine kinase
LPGAGLGLSIRRLIVENHGGRIWLEDADRGTRIRFSLPRSHPPGSADGPAGL